MLNYSDDLKSDIAWRRCKKYEDSIIHNIFSGQLQSNIKCQSCKHISSTFDVVMDLSIPVASSATNNYTSLDECMNGFFKEELLETPYECSKCKSQSKATKKLYISRAPTILVLHLKRFKTENESFMPSKKLSHHVSFPVRGLSLKEFESPFLNLNESIYSLVAISNHFGSLFGGHYTATTKNWMDNNWCDRNDNSVTSLANRESMHDTKSAYILFYERQNIPN